jgi:Icc-related predicted phosphoesterase
VIRVAAVGDVHYDRASRNRLRQYFKDLGSKADLLLLAGDLTQSGAVDEALALVDDLRVCEIPVITVLGNHDYHQDRQQEICTVLNEAKVITLEGESVVIKIRNYRVGVLGIKGFGGGFGGACITEFGEPETKIFAQHAKKQAEILRVKLEKLDTDFRFILLHYAPVDSTLLGEKREIYPFLGSYLFAEAIDSVGADGIFHGHAHYGTERGSTPGGIPVRNVAQTVIRHAYNVYTFDHPLSRGAQPDIYRPSAQA